MLRSICTFIQLVLKKAIQQVKYDQSKKANSVQIDMKKSWGIDKLIL
jgi:hypothetical protein